MVSHVKQRLVMLVAAVALTGCGGATSGEAATEAASSATPTTPSSTTSPPVEKGVQWTQLRIISITGAGGEVDRRLHPLATRAQVTTFVKRLSGRAARARVRRAAAAAAVPRGHVLMGSVVALGCVPPTEVEVVFDTGRPTVLADLPEQNLQCFAAITSVALVSIRKDLVGTD